MSPRPVVLIGPDVDDETRAVFAVPVIARALADAGEVRFSTAPGGTQEFREELAEADALVLIRNLETADLGEEPRVEIVSVTATGYQSYVDAPALESRGIRVGHVPAYGAAAVAEHAVALILAVAKNLLPSDRSVRAGGWPQPVSTQLDGKVAGVVGLGPIGRRTVELLEGLGMDVVVWTRDAQPDRLSGTRARYVDLAELFRGSDVISLHLGLNAGTRGLVSSELIAHCRPGAILVNTARDEVVEENALFEAVREGRVRAAVDVLRDEPPSREDLTSLPGDILVTPHTAYNTPEAVQSLMLGAIRNVTTHFSGTGATH